MSTVSNTYDTTNPGSATGNIEGLRDILSILEPEDTPILSALNKKDAIATNEIWIVDKLDSPSTEGVPEGADVTAFADKFEGRARLSNYVQKFRRPYRVSDLQQAVDSVGPAKEAQAKVKCMKEIKRDIEATLASNNDRSIEDGAGSVYKLRALGDWIDSAGPDDVPADYRTPAGAIESDASANFNETNFNEYITALFRVTGKTNSLLCVADTRLRRTISDFHRLGDQTATIRNVNYPGGSSEITLSVEIYKSDHGNITIVNGNPDCMPTTTVEGWAGYLVNLEYAGIHELIPLQMQELENQGGGPRGYCDCTLTLAVYHPGAHGKITD